MPSLLPGIPLDAFSRLEELTPALYVSDESGIAIVFNSNNGSAMLTSQFGSNITACPLHKRVTENLREASEQYLFSHGFKPEPLPAESWKEKLCNFIAMAGFTSDQVDRTLQLCIR